MAKSTPAVSQSQIKVLRMCGNKLRSNSFVFSRDKRSSFNREHSTSAMRRGWWFPDDSQNQRYVFANLSPMGERYQMKNIEEIFTDPNLILETGSYCHIRRSWHFDIECPEAVFVLLDEVIQQKGKPLRRMGAEYDAIGELDGHFLLASMPGLVHAKHQNDLLTRAHGVAHVRV
jgi:hypothetical protein